MEILFGRRVENDVRRLDTYRRRDQRMATFSTRRMDSTVPGRVRVVQAKTAITSGYQFRFYLLGSASIQGYNVYRSLTNNSNVAMIWDFIPQPPVRGYLQSAAWQETTSDNPFYWISAIGQNGREGPRVPMAGNPAPIPQPNERPPADGGYGGGAVRGPRGRGDLYTD